jgi:hypothetical protein
MQLDSDGGHIAFPELSQGRDNLGPSHDAELALTFADHAAPSTQANEG